MSERELWLEAALRWDSPQVDDRGQCYLIICESRNYGLCDTIAFLCRGLDEGVEAEMFRKLRKYAPREDGRHFRWGLKAEDAAQRAAFCRRMAEMCEPAHVA